MLQSRYRISAELLSATAATLNTAAGLSVIDALNGVVISRGINRTEAWSTFGVASMAIIHLEEYTSHKVKDWERVVDRDARGVILRMCSQWCYFLAQGIESAPVVEPEDRPAMPDSVILVTPLFAKCSTCGHTAEMARRRWTKGGEEFSVICPSCEAINKGKFSAV